MASIRFTREADYDPDNSDAVGLSSQYKGINTAYKFDIFHSSDRFNNNFQISSSSNSADFFYDFARAINYKSTNAGALIDFSDNTAVVNLTGGNFGDVLIGGSAGDRLSGGGGNDVLEGGAGADRLDGGTGSNTASYEHSTSGVTADLGGINELTGDANGDVYTNIQNLRGSASPDSLIGRVNQSNILEGGGGGDLILGNGAEDYASYVHSNVGVIVNLANQGANSGGDAGGDILYNIYNIFGSDFDDVLTGDGIVNTFDGGDGNDILDGGLGADNLTGGLGNDSYIVDDENDQVVEAANGGVDSVFVRPSAVLTSYTLASGQEIEVLATTRAIGGRDIDLTGNEKSQNIFGNAGANVLDGKAGADQLVGGAGADTFVFSTALGTDNVDRIVDFSEGDAIRLSKSIFTELDLGTLGEGAFKDLGVQGAAIDADDHIIYDAKGRLFYDADGAGGEAAVLFARVSYRPELSHDDFFVV